ncbi:MAG TPA: hypothetical protein VG711_06745 [Phycisphaerales bacterium]|nr:hypothetical protein [Phycisphaerales bacterium]
MSFPHAQRRIVLVASCALATVFTSISASAGISDDVGYNLLLGRLGLGAPNGAGVPVAQIEAPPSGNDYEPNTGLPQFAGKVFTFLSGTGGISPHANDVGGYYYGVDANSIAQGITSIYCYSAGGWVQNDYLRTGQGNTIFPLATPGGVKIMNNSWVGDLSPAAANNDCLRRADYVITRDNILLVNGVNNAGNPAAALMADMYNGVAVGLANGQHVSDPTPATLDGPGRLKPEIVADAPYTSYSTPIVSAACAVLEQTAMTDISVSADTNARRPEVIKAVLLAGAVHRAGWTNNPVTSGASRGITTQPIDAHYGVDVVNVNNSHLILTGAEQNGQRAVPASMTATWTGWDLASVNDNSSMYYRFHVCNLAPEVSILATWNRQIPIFSSAGTSANFTLTLWKVQTASTSLQTLVGNPGLSVFTTGNVVSQSSVDNIEHLYINNLQPGDYVLQVSRSDGLGGSRDVAVAWQFSPSSLVQGDATGDCLVNIDDLTSIILSWGTCTNACPADLNNDGVVDIDDLTAVILGWS